MPGNPDKSLCSMGIYIFNADYLFDALVRDMHKENTSHDFGKDIIPEAVAKGVAMSHAFSGSCVHGVGEPDNQEDYWRDVGTIDSFWESQYRFDTHGPETQFIRLGLADLDRSAAASARQIRA